MSARVEVDCTYYGYCLDCRTGTADNGTEEEAVAWAVQHNEERHS